MPQTGYLLISDISGYTAFLTQAELEHAHDILNNLTHALLNTIKSPLLVSKLEGDAIFCYTPDGSLLQRQTLLDMVENLYFSFTHARELMKINTNCTCTACTMIPTLDLKFVVHHGTFIVSDMQGREELSGPDVIVVHRLLKNEIVEQTGVKAYAYFTEACDLKDMCEPMKAHSETYDHIGDVHGHVYDLRSVWETQRERRRFRVTPQEAWVLSEGDIPAPPAVVWDYITDPIQKNRWMGVQEIRTSQRQSGRQTNGSMYHCVHGSGIQDFMIVDWSPFEYMTTRDVFPMAGVPGLSTIELSATETGTHIRMMYEKPRNLQGIRKLFTPVIVAMLKKIYTGFFDKYPVTIAKIIQEDASAGKLVIPTS